MMARVPRRVVASRLAAGIGAWLLCGAVPAAAFSQFVPPTPTPTPTPRPAQSAAAFTREPDGHRARPSKRRSTRRPLAPAAQPAAPTLDTLPSPIVVGEQVTLSGTAFTAGSVIMFFVATASGAQGFGPFTPSAWSPSSLTWTVDPNIPLGNGFASVLVVNTDQGYVQSNVQSQLLYGSAALNIPTILSINGVSLRPVDPTIPTANVETIVPQASTLTIGGSGFNAPLVNLFTASGNVGPLTPLAGGTSTQIQVDVPAQTPTGPGSLQVVNSPYMGNVLSNAVSVPIGAPVTVAGVAQNGSTITVTGTGFSSLSIINLFNRQGGAVANLGGLWPTTGTARIPLTIVSPNELTFAVPPGSIPGPAYVQVLNPPFIPFSSSGSDPDGAFTLTVPLVPPGGSSLRFFGTGQDDIDRVKIPIDAPARPADVGGHFTLEWWMKTAAGNASGSCVSGGDGWINGNIIFDRDVFGSGDFGDYGVSVFGTGGRIAFGVDRQGTGTTICGTANVADAAWHHVAVTRNSSTGQMRIFVDGQLDATGSGPTGDVSYRDGRATSWPSSDPFLVIGAEKHDAGTQYPSYHGWVDEVRLSNAVRYTGAFTSPANPFTTDANTVALYHFDEGNGNTVFDRSGAAGGPSNGVRRVGGVSAGPQWSTDTPFATGAPAIALDTLTASLTGPTAIAHAGDNRLFITEQGGQIRIWDGTQLLATPFLTVSPISSGGERGLLGLAFHPQYAQNGFFFVNYTDPAGDTVVARYRVSGDPNVADPTTGVTLLAIDQPASNHNGGNLAFGSDGYLYVGMGDGGGGCDNAGAGCNAQRDNTLLGKMLRLDVNQNVNAPPFYGIPPSNPFVGPDDPPDEVWAKGLRNPWRYAFDRLTGALFTADVGQGSREEVDYQPAESSGGENYGWKVMEGSLCNVCSLADCPGGLPACNAPSLTLPILEYSHAAGNCSVTGGFVYRGTEIPFLYGTYVFGDLCSGRLWWASQNGGVWTATQFTPTAGGLWTFGQDVHGELYLGRGNGSLVRIRPGP